MKIDANILLWINGHYADRLDGLMWWVSEPHVWIPLYLILVGCIVWRYWNWKAVLIILISFGIAVGLSDFVASGILKPLVCRLRPTHEPALDPIRLLHGYCGGRYGFCSSHAANMMACATLFSLFWRKKTATAALMAWVALVCYSRMYLGVHYPSDIIAGLLLGALFAAAAYLLASRALLWVGGAARQGGS